MSTASAPDAPALHHDALVVDAASFFCTGYDDGLAASGVDVVSVMAPWPPDDFERGVRRIEAYYRLVREEPRLRLIERVDDVAAARAAGAVGLVLVTQNAKLIDDRLDPATRKAGGIGPIPSRSTAAAGWREGVREWSPIART